MPNQLVDKIRKDSARAERKAVRDARNRQIEEKQQWEKTEKSKADTIIAKLPGILEKVAKENHKDGPYFPEFGHRKYRVLTLEQAQGDDGIVENLLGAAAHIRDWALTNGFKVELYLDIDTGTDWSGYHMYIEW